MDSRLAFVFLGVFLVLCIYLVRLLQNVISSAKVTSYPPSKQAYGREPQTFTGADPLSFAPWAFEVEEALSRRNLAPPEEISYAASFLSNNAKIWFITLCEDGKRPTNWSALKTLLSASFGPSHNKERTRFTLLSARQEGPLEGYIQEFVSLSLMLPEIDEHTKATLFIKGLDASLRRSVMQEHPESVQQAVRSARCAEDLAKLNVNGASPSPSDSPPVFAYTAAEPRRPLQKLTPEERQRLMKERRCFRCRRSGHIAKFCRHPNDVRQ